MTWDTERKVSGKQPFNWIEVELARCIRTYGSAPCTAALSATTPNKCSNGWETCQDRPNYSAATFWLRLCEAVAGVPLSFTFSGDGMPFFLPLLRNVDHQPGLPNPGESMGMRARFTAKLVDAPHHDIGLDKYALERISGAASFTGATFNPAERSTFFRKLKARFPHYIGKRVRWYQGYLTAAPALTDFRMREYVIEKIEGPDAKGNVTIVCKDVLKLVDNERAQWPLKSKGSLSAALTAVATPSTLDVNTTDLTEYDLTGGDTIGYVRIGDEIIQYTGTSLPGGNVVRLTGVTRAAPSPYVTVPAAHDLGDLVQRCRYLSGRVADVVEDLLLAGGVDAAFIPTADWTTEAETWATDNISRLITEPEGIQDLINEIIEQTLTWGIWFEETEQEIKYRALRPVDPLLDIVVPLTDAANVVAGSVVVKDEPEKAINEVQVLYGQINPTDSKDEIKNYRAGYVTIDADSQSANELDQRRVKRVFARWHPTSNAGVVSRWAERTLRAKAKNLVSVEFKMERKDENIPTSQFADLTTLYIVDQFGMPRTIRVQVVRANASGEQMTYKAREDFFKGVAFGRWAPEALSGLDYDDATALQKAMYIFWANDTGLMNNGDSGKGWL